MSENTQLARVVETALTPYRSGEMGFSAWDSPHNFEVAQRMAKMLSASSMVPERFRGNIGDCVIALEMSRRIGANVVSVMQNLYVVHGQPAWSSQFLIACINASGRFTPMRYRMTGEKGADSFGCIAWAEDIRNGEKLEGPEVTVKMSKDEGWYGRNGSKWKTMPELMLRYRSATLFARLYAPEITMGIRTEDEVVDIAPVVTDPRVARPVFAHTPEDQIPGAEPEPEPQPEQKPSRRLGRQQRQAQQEAKPEPQQQPESQTRIETVGSTPGDSDTVSGVNCRACGVLVTDPSDLDEFDRCPACRERAKQNAAGRTGR